MYSVEALWQHHSVQHFYCIVLDNTQISQSKLFDLYQQTTHTGGVNFDGDYLGIGAGAHSKISFADRIVRQMRYKNPREYLVKTALDTIVSDVPIQEQHEVSRDDRQFEFLMNALRLTGGFETGMFQERTGLPITVIQQQLDEAEQRGLVVRDHQRIMPTSTGRRFLNDLLQIFLPDKSDI